jgi:hypothetical protein
MSELDLVWKRLEGHHRLTVRVVEAFPEDKLVHFTPIEPLRTFAQITGEILQLKTVMIPGIVSGEWKPWDQSSHLTKLKPVVVANHAGTPGYR